MKILAVLGMFVVLQMAAIDQTGAAAKLYGNGGAAKWIMARLATGSHAA